MNKRRMYVLLCLVVLGLVLPVSAADDPSLVGWWRLDDGSGDTAADSSEYGNNGTLMGGPIWVEGQIGRALEFDGATQYVEVPHVPILTVDTEVTVMCWFNTPRAIGGTGDNWQGLMAKSNSPRSYSLYTYVGNKFHFVGGNGSVSSGTFELNEWTHVAASVLNGQHQYWINGEDGGTGGGGSVLPGAADTAPVYLGRTGEGLASRALLGMLDDARIYNRALTQEEIAVAMLGSPSAPIAETPNPAGGATDVPYYTNLSWGAGEFAASHNVYFGTSWDDVNAASVDNPMDVLAAQGLTETRLELESLEFETTYFWRVDEVNSPPDSTIFKGEVWDFVTEPVAYPVADVTAAASSTHEASTDAVRTVDGSGLNANDEHTADLADMWLSNAAETEGVWIEYDLGKAWKLDHVRVWNHNSQTEMILGYGIKEALIEISSDGETWTELKTTEIPQASGLGTYTGAAVALDGAIAQYVRITALSNYSILGLKQFGLSEVRFYSIPVLAREPNPAHGGVSDGVDVVLQWRAGREAAEHEVVFSDDGQAVIDGSAVVGMADLSFDVGTLDLATEYFWKINSVGDTIYEGDFWSFRTREALMIDDFEMYKAQEGLRIWEHWLDGFENQAENGAVVGNGDDAETSVVYEGRQSMPIAFNNTLAPKSEATRFFDVPVDLTKGSPESLKLQVVGDPNNGAAPMYLILADTAGSEKQIDHPDPAATVITAWDEWTIPLGDLSPVDVTKIDSITVGVGTAGVEGMIFVDAIRTHSPPSSQTFGLLAQYPFDEGAGTEVADISGKGQDGAFVGEPVWVPGKTGTALQFDGTDDYVEIPHDGALNVDNEVTLALWINPERYVSEGEGWGGIMAKGGPRLYSLFTTAAGELHFSTAGVGTVSSETFPLNEWSHVTAMVVNGGHAYYINGAPAGTAGSGINLGGVVNTAPVTIGNINEPNRFYQGVIDEVSIFSRALTAEEVAELAE